MKKLLCVFLLALIPVTTMAQNNIITPQINVTGEGSIKIKPNYAVISIGSEIKTLDATKSKKQNDDVISKLIQVIKKAGVNEKDYQTQNVNLYRTKDYQDKKEYFVANQTISITLKDLNKYETLMSDLIDAGANSINGVEFKSTEVENFASEIRKKAVANAKKKADDYASALNQNVGKALIVNDNSNINNPRVYMFKAANMAESADVSQTLAVGEIEISSMVNITFELK